MSVGKAELQSALLGVMTSGWTSVQRWMVDVLEERGYIDVHDRRDGKPVKLADLGESPSPAHYTVSVTKAGQEFLRPPQ
ncbi:hypothetical protein [Variovorax sp.]|jgi:hypothetical protein|uniref:hypothetical protein n=1 Tax=Variovorax sp. TaxID=1871043 RepID=UPI00122A50B1|nr:hypothetical protein [Variovorax sp.]TAJ56485.1 MAG: hypothetical protein EPO53_40230 [Variovorax sp.]